MKNRNNKTFQNSKLLRKKAVFARIPKYHENSKIMIFGQRKKKALANKLYKTNCHPTKSCGLLRKVTFSQPSDFITQSKDIKNLAKVCNRFNKSEKFWLRRLL